MDELDGHRSLADRRGDALDRAGATSPAANTPARLVSSRKGGRRRVQAASRASAGPVRMKPFASRSISGGSQSVRGIAPMKLNTAGRLDRPASPSSVGDFDRAEVPVAEHAPDRRVRAHLDVGGLLDAAGEVAGHVLVQVVAADQR